MDFFLANLSYEHPSGREAVLEMLHDILTRFPQRIIDDQGQTFFHHLVVALADEQHQNVSSMILRAIQKLLGRIGDQGKSYIFEYSLSWYTGEKKSLWSASAQVIGLLVGDHITLRTGKHLKSILAVVKKIMESSVIASGAIQLGLSDEAVLPLWKALLAFVTENSWETFRKGLIQMPNIIPERCCRDISDDDSDEVKQLAQGVQNKLRDLIGSEKFVEVYKSVWMGLKQKRDSRKQAQKIVAAVDPERHAKPKRRMVAKHQEHKRRKIMAMKIGRWMR
ncbi:unnamed protein product [Miscanthus lutarioriparius]|uniref:U3 small nucleolar RNA-associated protein 20 C-terminal domain-containing protein n=1 Tax=Miscanthus lutarioriparius TaxID=422564 RepID=A0A811P425_9POAL|nr:unnamed protein product [Miscanthus lutarioriparius]